jgi:hypothetical protein
MYNNKNKYDNVRDGMDHPGVTKKITDYQTEYPAKRRDPVVYNNLNHHDHMWKSIPLPLRPGSKKWTTDHGSEFGAKCSDPVVYNNKNKYDNVKDGMAHPGTTKHVTDYQTEYPSKRRDPVVYNNKNKYDNVSETMVLPGTEKHTTGYQREYQGAQGHGTGVNARTEKVMRDFIGSNEVVQERNMAEQLEQREMWMWRKEQECV